MTEHPLDDPDARCEHDWRDDRVDGMYCSLCGAVRNYTREDFQDAELEHEQRKDYHG